VTFQRGSGAIVPRISETLVAARGRASELLATFASALNGCGTLHYASNGVTSTITVTQAKLGSIGDRSAAFKMVVSAGILTLPFYILAAEVKNNTLAVFAYTAFGQGADTAQLVRIAKDGIAKLRGKQSPDYGNNAPKAVGQSVQYDDGQGSTATITLVRVIDPAQPSNQYETPDPGDRLIAAEFKIVNTGTAFQPEPNLDATAFDSAAHSYSTDYRDIAGCPSFANNVALYTGDTVDGCVAFRAPSGAQITKIEYTEQGGAGSGTWVLQPGSASG
jgi:hypothetical protein